MFNTLIIQSNTLTKKQNKTGEVKCKRMIFFLFFLAAERGTPTGGEREKRRYEKEEQMREGETKPTQRRRNSPSGRFFSRLPHFSSPLHLLLALSFPCASVPPVTPGDYDRIVVMKS